MATLDHAQHAIVVQLRRDMEPHLNSITDAITGVLENASQKPWADFMHELQSIQAAVDRFRLTINASFESAGRAGGFKPSMHHLNPPVSSPVRSMQEPLIPMYTMIYGHH